MMNEVTERDLLAEIEACKRILKGEQRSVRAHLDSLVKAQASLVAAEKALEDAEQKLNEYRNRCL
jgi:prefoldin subunit 5